MKSTFDKLESGALTEQMIMDESMSSCHKCKYNFEPLLGAYPLDKRYWHVGDIAIYKDRKMGCIVITEQMLCDHDFVNVDHMRNECKLCGLVEGSNDDINLNEFLVPNRKQLSVNAYGIKVWARELTPNDTLLDYNIVELIYEDDRSNDYIRPEMAKMIGVHIVNKDQIDRQYDGIFPPEK